MFDDYRGHHSRDARADAVAAKIYSVLEDV